MEKNIDRGWNPTPDNQEQPRLTLYRDQQPLDSRNVMDPDAPHLSVHRARLRGEQAPVQEQSTISQ